MNGLTMESSSDLSRGSPNPGLGNACRVHPDPEFLYGKAAPSGPEVDQHHLAAQALQVPFPFLNVGESEVGIVAMLVVGLELGNCSRVPRVVERNLHMIVSSQFCQNPVRRIASILGWRPAQLGGQVCCLLL